jgi:hypothetical protein
MVTQERTGRLPLEYKSHATLHAMAKRVGKASLELIKQAYIEWTHDNVDTDINMNEWQTMWAKRYGTNVGTKDKPKYVIDEYSFGYICKEMRSLRTAHEGGYALSQITKVGDIRKCAQAVSGKSDEKGEVSEADKLLARIAKADKRARRAVWKELNKEFG